MCGYEKDAKHALGKRFFYKWTKGYGQNIVYYAQKCTVCQQKLEGKVYYWDGYWFDWWSDTEKFLNKLIEEGYVDESWMVSTGWKFGLWGVQTSYKVADFLWKALSVIQGTQGVYDPGHVVIVSTPVLSASDSDTPFEKQDHPIMDKIDLTSARITADYDKLLKPGGDVECVAAWKDSAGAIEAAKAKKKETPDSNGAKGGAVFEAQEKGGADQDGGGSTPAEEKEYELGDDWENAEEPVRMLKDSAAIDGLTRWTTTNSTSRARVRNRRTPPATWSTRPSP